LGKTWGQSLGMYACFAMDLLAECRVQQVATEARSTALGVRFIVADREFKERFFVPNPPPPPPVSAQCMFRSLGGTICVDASAFQSGGLLLCLVKPVAV
jgi:hypothetical protein